MKTHTTHNNCSRAVNSFYMHCYCSYAIRPIKQLITAMLLATTAFADPIHDAAKTGDLAGVQAELDKGIDIQMSLGDLGHLLRPSIQSFGSNSDTPALRPNSQKRKKLRRNYEEQASGRPLIGLSWHSSAPELGALKSLGPDVAASIIKNTDAQYISLQYSPSAEDVAVLSSAGADRWIHDTSVDPLVDMELATAQVAAMDFVVTISNTTAHIAGGLGIPTALLIPRHTGRFWYWSRDQPMSLWYPSVQVYESDGAFDWTYALTQITERINHLSQAQ